jgi:hypothetical protein
MHVLYFALQDYAAVHQGWFPQSDKGPAAALQKLYPEYVSATVLAGVTGDRKDIGDALQNGMPLTDDLTSWVYIQGLTTNDPHELAIVWERTNGYFANGYKDPSGGRAVLFLDGDTRQVSPSDWPAFLKNQELLRRTAATNRSQ